MSRDAYKRFTDSINSTLTTCKSEELKSSLNKLVDTCNSELIIEGFYKHYTSGLNSIEESLEVYNKIKNPNEKITNKLIENVDLATLKMSSTKDKIVSITEENDEENLEIALKIANTMIELHLG